MLLLRSCRDANLLTEQGLAAVLGAVLGTPVAAAQPPHSGAADAARTLVGMQPPPSAGGSGISTSARPVASAAVAGAEQATPAPHRPTRAGARPTSPRARLDAARRADALFRMRSEEQRGGRVAGAATAPSGSSDGVDAPGYGGAPPSPGSKGGRPGSRGLSRRQAQEWEAQKQRGQQKDEFFESLMEPHEPRAGQGPELRIDAADGCSPRAHCGSSLETLDLSGNMLGHGAALQLAAALPALPALRLLLVDHNHVPAAGVATLRGAASAVGAGAAPPGSPAEAGGVVGGREGAPRALRISALWCL